MPTKNYIKKLMTKYLFYDKLILIQENRGSEMEEGKVCTKCKKWKSYFHFHKYSRMSDGYEIYCKPCRKAKYKAREYYSLNGKQVKKRFEYGKPRPYTRRTFVKRGNPLEIKIINGEAIEGKLCTSCNEWKSKNQYHKFSRLQDGLEIYCKKCRKEMTSQYFQTEKGKANSYRSNSKRRSFKHHVFFKPHERKNILDRDNWTCQYCNCKVHDKSTGNWNTPNKAHIDHIIPLTEGGNSEPLNLQVLCRTCNLSKSNKMIDKIKKQMTLDFFENNSN